MRGMVWGAAGVGWALALGGCMPGAVASLPARNPLRNGGASTSAVVIAPRQIGFGVLEDALSPGDPTDAEGRHLRVFEVALEAGRRVRFRVPSGAIDPMLRLEGPDGLRVENDDVLPHSLDALLEVVPATAGRHRLVVTTAPVGQTGPFRLEVTARDVGGMGPRMTLGQPFAGTLGPVQDAALPGAALSTFEAPGGAVVRLRVTSAAFDTFVTVLGPGGQRWTNDDANDLGVDGTERALDSTLVLAVPESGVYQVAVTSFAPAGAGAFRISSQVRPPVLVPAGQTAPQGPFAGPEGRGRILGLYAGITAYESQGRLYGCADDARLLGDAMRAARLQRSDEQIVLTDAQSTRGAFLGALGQLAARAQPEDVVMVFWSGHGNAQPAPGGTTELDGLDETIQMIDGPLTDDEVVGALDAVRAGTVVLALDSCHSGGFADDFGHRPGRIGLYSSDEDVLSDTAEPRGAGGYLSYHLRMGVLGHGDHKPRDGVLYAGELTDYLIDGFVADHRLMNPEGASDPSQRLDVRRGSVGWNTVMWVYPRGEDLRLPPVPTADLTSPRP